MSGWRTVWLVAGFCLTGPAFSQTCDPGPPAPRALDWIDLPGVQNRISEYRGIVREAPQDEGARQVLADLAVQLALAVEEAEARDRPEETEMLLRLIREDLPDTLWRAGHMAKNGNERAMTTQGLIHRKGIGSEKDPEAACRWYLQAADAGEKYGLYRASLCTVQTDPETSVDYMQLAAKRGHASAQEAVGQACLNREEPEAAQCAVLWLEQAARQGRIRAASLAGWLFFSGDGTERDLARAFELYCTGARGGDPFAQNNLAEFFERGWPGQPDLPAAAMWYRRGADAGFPPAQANLGRLYATGAGVEQNPVQARYWLEQAAAQGFEPAVRYLQQWSDGPTSLTPDESSGN